MSLTPAFFSKFQELKKTTTPQRKRKVLSLFIFKTRIHDAECNIICGKMCIFFSLKEEGKVVLGKVDCDRESKYF